MLVSHKLPTHNLTHTHIHAHLHTNISITIQDSQANNKVAMTLSTLRLISLKA